MQVFHKIRSSFLHLSKYRWRGRWAWLIKALAWTLPCMALVSALPEMAGMTLTAQHSSVNYYADG